MTPEISCVLPVYNGEKYLAESIESVLNQTFQDFELIIVDDGSTDKSREIMNEYRHKDPRVRNIYHCKEGDDRYPINYGLPAALNTGFQAATGDYFTWASADNQYKPTAFEDMLATIKHHSGKPDVVYADEDLVDDDGTPIGYFKAADPKWLIYYNVVHACFLYKNTDLRYDEDLPLAEDWAFWLQGLVHGWTFQPINENLYTYRHHLGSLTAKRRQCQDAADRAFWKYVPGIAGLSVWDSYRALIFRKRSRLENWWNEVVLRRRYY